MNKALLATAACAALGLTAATQAAVTVQIVSKGTPTNGATVATGYTGYVIRLVSDSGNITAVDASTGALGITGRMVQRWTDSDGDDVPEVSSPGYLGPDNSTGNANNFDSHYLSHPANPANPADPFNADAVSPNETFGSGTFGGPGANPPFPNNVSNGPFVGVGGPNGTLKVSVGIKAFAQATTFDLAYVVLPNTATDSFSASVATANGTFPVSASIPPIPEPTTLSLAGLGALGMLARRRRA